MRLLLTNYLETTSPGGINKCVREIAKEMSSRGHFVRILQPNPLRLTRDSFQDGCKILRIPSRIDSYAYGLSPAAYVYLTKSLDSINPEVIHIHGYHTLFSPEIVLALKKIIKSRATICFTPHYDDLNHSTVAGKLFGKIYDQVVGRSFLKLIDQFICISAYERDKIRKIFDVPLSKTMVVPHGVDYIKAKDQNHDGPIHLLYVGYLLKYKGVQRIIKALHQLIYAYSWTKVRLKIIGEGAYKRDLVALSRKLHVYEYIEWISFLPHPKVLEAMSQADILILLSQTEGYGIVVAEALALGVPTIVTQGTALEEFTSEPGCYGVPRGPNPKILADLILKIFGSRVTVGPFSSKIRTWEAVVEDYEGIYLQSIENDTS